VENSHADSKRFGRNPLVNYPLSTLNYSIALSGRWVGEEFFTHPVGAGYNPDAPIGANGKNKNFTDILQ
jgi:hypothetical protein